MVAKEYYDTLLKITDIMEEKGGGIIYIRNEPDCYTIGTRYYDEDIAEFLDNTVEERFGEESTLQKKSKKRSKKQDKVEELYYLWKITLPE